MTISIARVCHEANRALCEAFGDDSQLPWEEAPEWQRASAVSGVKAILADPDAPPSRSHELWSEHKISEGWSYGEEKDEEAKTHPCLVPYDELPADQQAKDYIFAAIARTLKEELGL